MRQSRWPWMLVGVVVSALAAAGCQTFHRDSVNTGGGPSRSFGLDYVPRQSEPPIADAAEHDVAGTSPSRAKIASLEEPAEGPGKPAGGLARLLPGREKELPKSKPLPVSSRTPSSTEPVERIDEP